MAFCVYIPILLLLISPISCQIDADIVSKRKPKEINVILFFVNTNTSNENENDCGGHHEDNTAKSLNFTKATVILPCTPEKEAEVTGSINRILRYSQNSCDCKNLLKSSLMSLIGYARNAIGLTTAVSSISETELQPKGDIALQDNKNVRQNVFQIGAPEASAKHFQSSGQRKYEPEIWLRKNQKSKLDSLFTPGTVDVFNITSGIKEKREQDREIVDVPIMKEKPKTAWDTLGLMKTIRQSFFDSFFNPIFDKQKNMYDEEDGLNLKLLGQVQQPSMFELVRRTLRQLQLQKVDSGYLVTFFGGNLCDMRNPRSDLMQSVKHVLENSKQADTLAILTGSCPKNGRIGSDEEIEIPLFVRGPKSEVFYKAKELYDVPKLVQVAIKEHHEDVKRYNSVYKENYNLAENALFN